MSTIQNDSNANKYVCLEPQQGESARVKNLKNRRILAIKKQIELSKKYYKILSIYKYNLDLSNAKMERVLLVHKINKQIKKENQCRIPKLWEAILDILKSIFKRK